jgi:hypothetical protein
MPTRRDLERPKQVPSRLAPAQETRIKGPFDWGRKTYLELSTGPSRQICVFTQSYDCFPFGYLHILIVFPLVYLHISMIVFLFFMYAIYHVPFIYI